MAWERGDAGGRGGDGENPSRGIMWRGQYRPTDCPVGAIHPPDVVWRGIGVMPVGAVAAAIIHRGELCGAANIA